ncbi:MAG: ABC transporter permease [Lachnospiraceae bacterium]|nr:ABC transporter permease [Lachnospiraceae bacterium]
MVYSTRIIRLLDGKVISDSMPIGEEAGDESSAAASDMVAGTVNKEMEQGGKSALTDSEGKRNGHKPRYWLDNSGTGTDTVRTDECAQAVSEEGALQTKTSGQDAANASQAASGTGAPAKDPANRPVSDTAGSEVLSEKDKKKQAKAQKAQERNRAKEEKALLKAMRPPRTSMKLFTALGLSMNNLLTKKARTILTAFAGSIGIIGIALILSLSNGVQEYIDRVEEDTLSSYPVTIEGASIDMTSVMTSFQESSSNVEKHEPGQVYTNAIMNSMIKVMIREAKTNNLADFRRYIEDNRSRFDKLTSDISYLYSTPLNIYRSDVETEVFQVNPQQVFKKLGMGRAGGSMGYMTTDVFTRLIDNDELLEQQYSILKGRMPRSYDEVVMIVSNNYDAVDFTFYALGMLDIEELKEMFGRVSAGEEADPPETRSYSYDEILNMSFRLMINTDYFEKQEDGTWADKSDDEVYMINRLKEAPEIKVVGILRSESDAAMNNLSGMIGYRTDLMDYLIERINDSEIVKQQKDHPDIDVFTGIPFDTGEEQEPLTMDMLQAFIMTLPAEEQAATMESLQQMRDYGMDDARILEAFSTMMSGASTDATYDGNLSKMGVSDIESPSSINIYPKDFESKDSIMKLVDEYNEGLDEKDQIKVTDYIGLIMSSVTTIINAISYILIAFVAISLVVSSIMIGIITYISVLERTKEIGILRAVGASKKDISRVFNAETLIIGFTAGFLGIVIAEFMLIPINAIIYNITEIKNIAVMPPVAAVALVVISMLLTFIAGLFPSRIAARKDPVVALRTE